MGLNEDKRALEAEAKRQRDLAKKLADEVDRREAEILAKQRKEREAEEARNDARIARIAADVRQREQRAAEQRQREDRRRQEGQRYRDERRRR